MSYYITFDSSGGLALAHGAEWRRHKYIRKEGNRYIYPEDLKKQQAAQEAVRQAQERGAHKTGRYASQPGGRDAAAERERAADITAQRRRAADNAQASGKKRTEQYKSGGYDSMQSTLYPDGSRRTQTNYTNVRKEQELEANKAAREKEKRRIDADWAAYEAQRRGERQTKLEDRRALERGAAKGRKLMEIEKRGQQQTRDFYERENMHEYRYYNVSKDTPGAIKKSHGSFGTTEQFKLESAKEHRERLSEGVKDRKNKVLFDRAVNSVERFGAKTVKSIADSAKKGANWVSNLFKKKK